MKVIKKGRPQKGWSQECVCSGAGNGGGGCGAKLLVEQPDLFITRNYCRDECDVYTTFKCVECGVLTDLTGSQKPPSNVYAALPEKNKWVDPNSEAAAKKKADDARNLLVKLGYKVVEPNSAETFAEYMGH